jgi:hypothetical protein
VSQHEITTWTQAGTDTPYGWRCRCGVGERPIGDRVAVLLVPMSFADPVTRDQAVRQHLEVGCSRAP